MKRKTDNFNKFYNKKNNAAIKEGFKQEKKAAKKERVLMNALLSNDDRATWIGDGPQRAG